MKLNDTLTDIAAVVIAAPIIIGGLLFKYLQHCLNVASHSFVRLLGLAVAAFLLWPLVDHCLLHFQTGVTLSLLKGEILTRWHWLLGLTISIPDHSPAGATTVPLFKAACFVVGFAVAGTAFLLFASVKETIEGVYNAVERRASDAFDRISQAAKAAKCERARLRAIRKAATEAK